MVLFSNTIIVQFGKNLSGIKGERTTTYPIAHNGYFSIVATNTDSVNKGVSTVKITAVHSTYYNAVGSWYNNNNQGYSGAWWGWITVGY